MNKVKNYIRPAIKCFHDFDKFYLLSGSPSEAQRHSQEGSRQQLAKELPFDVSDDEPEDDKNLWSD